MNNINISDDEIDNIFTMYDKMDKNLIIKSNMINEICVRINVSYNSEHKSYKLSYYEKLINMIFDIIIKMDKPEKVIFVNNLNFLITLTLLNCGHKKLNKIKEYIKYDVYNKDTIMSKVLMYGCFNTFIFWTKFFNLKFIDNYNSYISSVTNSDFRIFKYIMSNIISNNIILSYDNLNEITSNIINCSIPCVYKLKRLKFLSSYCNLKPHLINMLNKIPTFKITKQLMKYYYENQMEYYDINLLNLSYVTDDIQLKIELYDLLKTDNEKSYLLINNILSKNEDLLLENILKLDINIDKLLYNIMNIFEGFNDYLNNYSNNSIPISLLSNNSISILFAFFKKYDLFHKISYIYKNDYTVFNNCNYLIILLCRFPNVICSKRIKLNKTSSLLRMCLKRRIKNKLLNYKYKYLAINQELLNFKPMINKPILKYGSKKWQINHFSNQPPRHLLPSEINNYNNFLLREKADGIMVTVLPHTIYPKNNNIINRNIKAEYIEDLDLYLVFDIDIDKEPIERYNYLRSLHPYTMNTKIQNINNTNELIELINNERIILNKFIKETDNIKWYPKITFNVSSISEEFKSSLISDMIININSELNNHINNMGIYKCDGIIITPLSNNMNRDIKIKPKTLMTIDLLYDGVNWLDREKNNYNKIIFMSNMIKPNNIYRCYPTSNNMYEPREIRYDKTKPNNFDIINMVRTIYNYDWTITEDKITPYYQVNNMKLEYSYIKELKIQEIMFNNNIERLNPKLNKLWLDLGCGKCKLIENIKKFNPKKYIGIDYDNKILSDKINYIDIYDWVKLENCDLRNNWFEHSKWFNINNMTFDYIILNYSIMHLIDSDEFWKCLQKVCNMNTLILFNVVSDKIKSNDYILNDAYMKYDNGNIKYFFPWVHNIEHCEKFIEKNFILKKIIEYGFIVDNIIYNDNNLSSFYETYIIKQKN